MSTTRSLLLAAALLAPELRSQAPVPVPAPADVARPAKAEKPKDQVYDEQADARAAVAAAVRAAKRENRRVLIQWGANWCGWCKVLAAKMRGDGDLAKELQYEYDVMKVDVGRFDKNLDLAKDLGAEFKTILDGDGKAVVQQNTEPFETKGDGAIGHDAAKLLAFLTEHQAKPLDAAQQLAAAQESAKAGQKRVFLHFGAPWCPWCHQLDDWLAQSAVAALLGQDFVVVKIDTDRMTGGEKLLADQRARAGVDGGGIPWFVFLDADGGQLANSNAASGNVGFPSKDEEIAWFGEMLTKARVHLKDDDVTALKAMLTSWREASKARRGH